MSEISWKLASAAQFAALLEVSSPKPGNVNRLRRFSDTGYRHFLASASYLGKGLFRAAEKGGQVAKSNIQVEEIQLGYLIYSCISDVFGGLNRRNTILGTILLDVPLVCGVAACIHDEGKLSVKSTQKWLAALIEATTIQDAIHLYKGFHLIKSQGSLNRDTRHWTNIHDRYDIENPQALKNIEEDGTSLIELFRLSADVDPIAKEWSIHFDFVLNSILPILNSYVSGLDDFEEGVVKTFIWLLANQPDGLIIKKVGYEKALEVQTLAKALHETREIDDSDILLKKLDDILRSNGNLLNPGTTADLISAAIFCKILDMTF